MMPNIKSSTDLRNNYNESQVFVMKLKSLYLLRRMVEVT